MIPTPSKYSGTIEELEAHIGNTFEYESVGWYFDRVGVAILIVPEGVPPPVWGTGKNWVEFIQGPFPPDQIFTAYLWMEDPSNILHVLNVLPINVDKRLVEMRQY